MTADDCGGCCEPAAASTPIIVAGMSCTPDVVIARNVTIGIGGGLLLGVERLELLHRLDAERCRRVVQAQHVRGDGDDDRAASRMVGRHFRKQPPQQRPQRAAEQRHQPGRFGDAHHPQPQRHDPDEPDRDLHRGRRGVHAPRVTASTVPLKAATISATAIRPNQM